MVPAACARVPGEDTEGEAVRVELAIGTGQRTPRPFRATRAHGLNRRRYCCGGRPGRIFTVAAFPAGVVRFRMHIRMREVKDQWSLIV